MREKAPQTKFIKNAMVLINETDRVTQFLEKSLLNCKKEIKQVQTSVRGMVTNLESRIKLMSVRSMNLEISAKDVEREMRLYVDHHQEELKIL